MPFRSEAEQLREQTRRAEEQARDLEGEQAGLESQVRTLEGRGGTRAVLMVVAAAVAVSAATFIGFEAGAIASQKRNIRLYEDLAREQAEQLDAAQGRLKQCERDTVPMQNELRDCNRWLESLRVRARFHADPPPSNTMPAPGRIGIAR